MSDQIVLNYPWAYLTRLNGFSMSISMYMIMRKSMSVSMSIQYERHESYQRKVEFLEERLNFIGCALNADLAEWM